MYYKDTIKIRVGKETWPTEFSLEITSFGAFDTIHNLSFIANSGKCALKH